jgi:hypothetical protein
MMEIHIVVLWFMTPCDLRGRYQNFTKIAAPSNLNCTLQYLLGSMTLTDICLAIPQLAFVISKNLTDTWKATIHLNKI